MAEQPQIIVTPNIVLSKPMGARKDNNLTSCFPSSPIYLGEITDNERKATFDKLALNGKVLNGNGINSFDRDYSDAPDLLEVSSGGGGLPASPFVPNLTSPGPGSVNASDQPVYNGELPDQSTRQVSFGSGLGGLISPSVTSKQISEVSSIGSYISGRSYLGSGGK
jgi:hypothetical protein